MSIHEENTITMLSTLVNSWSEAFNNHNVNALVALYAEDAVLVDAGMKRPRQGRKEIEQWFISRFRSIPNITYTPTGQLFGEVQVAVLWTAQGRLSRFLGQTWLTRPFQIDGVSVFTIRNGRISKQRGYYDHLWAVEQVLPPLKWLLPLRL